MNSSERHGEACYFGAAARPRFGWLHRPAAAARVGIVIVPPFGYEAVCAARSLRHLAETAAASGLIALRFDLDGTGDSAGDDADPARLAAWLDSIDDACEVVRNAGAEDIVLVGVRLGVLLATLAAERRGTIAGLVAIAAVPTGKALLREGSALQMTLGLEAPPAGAEVAERELVGFAVLETTWAAIAGIDLRQSQKTPARKILLIDRDDRPPNDAWAAHLVALGATVTQLRLPGYVDMMLDPHRTTIPAAIIDAAIAFACELGKDKIAAPGPPAPPLPTRMVFQNGAASFDEEVIWPASHVFAIAARPTSPPNHAVILLNAGAIGHIGPNRLYVALSRRLAASGMLAIRCDLSGIGDSPSRSREEANTVYSPHALDDVSAVVRWARSAGASNITVAGLCSGGYHALRAALADVPIDRIIVINPLTFHYVPGAPLDVAAFRIATDAQRYGTSITSQQSWRKLLRGEVEIARIATVLLHRARARIAAVSKNILRTLRVPLHNDLGSELHTLARRGIAICFIFADGDPGRLMLTEEAGSTVPKLVVAGKLAVRTIDGADHTFTPRWTHAALLDAIENAVKPE